MRRIALAAGVFLLWMLNSETVAAQVGSTLIGPGAGGLAESFKWTCGLPILQAKNGIDENWVSVKDPSIIRYKDNWHLFCTLRGRKRTHAIVYLTFSDWSRAAGAEFHLLQCSNGYFCAPQVFYFTPNQSWYLICQASDEKWCPAYQAAYSTTTDIANPTSWSPLTPLSAKPANGNSGLDFWVICDDVNAYLFFTTLDGRMWREQTPLRNFPLGWSSPVLAIEGDIFEASHIYKVTGLNTYLTLVEAQGGYGWRYFKAYRADRLDGEWRPLAAEKDKAFASMRTVRQTAGHWTDSISHGELIRWGYDEKLEIAPDDMKFLFQGVSDQERLGKNYGEIPWRLGMLELER